MSGVGRIFEGSKAFSNQKYGRCLQGSKVLAGQKMSCLLLLGTRDWYREHAGRRHELPQKGVSSRPQGPRLRRHWGDRVWVWWIHK